MKTIGLLSDTHSFLHPKVKNYFANCTEIWHCGDIGNINIATELSSIASLRAVYGNIDGQDIRAVYPKFIQFECEKIKVLLTHIGGYPKKYNPECLQMIKKTKPDMFICGHSHILKIIYDKEYNLLHINPGAAGKFGIHNVITLIKFNISDKNISDLKIIELEK